VAELHASLIGDGFLSSLGPRFLARLYRRVVRSDDAFVLVVDAGGRPVGFIAGAMALGRLYRRFVVRDGVAAVAAAPLRLAGALPRVLETLRHGGDDDGGGGAELLAVAVDPAFRGARLGTVLVEGFLAEVARRGGGRAQVVVGADNAPAIAMYRRSGFAEVRAFELHPGTTSLVLAAATAAAPPAT